jgi:hypothetical protein
VIFSATLGVQHDVTLCVPYGAENHCTKPTLARSSSLRALERLCSSPQLEALDLAVPYTSVAGTLPVRGAAHLAPPQYQVPHAQAASPLRALVEVAQVMRRSVACSALTAVAPHTEANLEAVAPLPRRAPRHLAHVPAAAASSGGSSETGPDMLPIMQHIT